MSPLPAGSRSQEVVSHPVPLEYDSLAALRRHIAEQRSIAAPSTEPSPRQEPAATPAAAAASAAGVAGAQATAAGGVRHSGPVPPPPVEQMPDGYQALPVAGYLVIEPGSDQARFVVVDSRAGQTLMMRTSLDPGPSSAEDESDDRLRQVLETIAEESRSNIAVADGGEGASSAHERFRQVRRAVTGWHAYQEADESADITDVTSLTESRSVEAAHGGGGGGGAGSEQGVMSPRPASHPSGHLAMVVDA